MTNKEKIIAVFFGKKSWACRLIEQILPLGLERIRRGEEAFPNLEIEIGDEAEI